MNDYQLVKLNVLIVDDDANIRRTLSYCLNSLGHSVVEATNSSDCLAESSFRSFDLVLLDLKLGAENGMELIPVITSMAPWIKVVVITAHGTIDSAVEAMKLGAVDYIVKPFSSDQIKSLVRHISRIRGMEDEIDHLKGSISGGLSEDGLRTSDPIMQLALDTLVKASVSEASILLRGESGTGKSLLARAVHKASNRAGKVMATVACPSVPAELLEGELFGYVKGAFTGAVRDYPGKIASCEDGTLFLDEIGDMAPQVQAKLLHFLQEKEYERLGESKPRKANVRIIAATSANLESRSAEGRFRDDLLYRLNVIEVTLPPLRERRSDIMPLAKKFLALFCSLNHKSIPGFTKETVDILKAAEWPGNVRELRNAIERAVILGGDGPIKPSDLPGFRRDLAKVGAIGDSISLARLEELHIRRILAATQSLQAAAEILGIDQATLWRKRKALGIK